MSEKMSNAKGKKEDHEKSIPLSAKVIWRKNETQDQF